MRRGIVQRVLVAILEGENGELYFEWLWSETEALVWRGASEMEEAVWICEEPEAEVSFYGQSLEAIRSSGYAPYQPGPTSFSHFIYYLFISFNPKKKKNIHNVQLKAYRNSNIRHIRVLQFCPVPFNPSISVRDGIFIQFHLICLFPLRPQRLWSRDGVRF